MIEDLFFVPAVRLLEQQIKMSGQILYTDETNNEIVDNDKLDVLVIERRILSFVSQKE